MSRGKKYNPQDQYFNKAKAEGFAARSAFKLEEIDKKVRLIITGMKVLDLGSSPGSWLQYTSRKVGPNGKVFGVDIDPVRVGLPNVHFEICDLFSLKADDPKFKDYVPFDLIQSDAMTKTTGIAETDCARSLDLVEYALGFARSGGLKVGGSFLAKVFEGHGFAEFIVELRKYFEKVTQHRPEAVRKGSREVYVLGRGLKGA